MKNDFAFIRNPDPDHTGSPFTLVTPCTFITGREAETHDITRLEAESLLEEMIQALGGWVRESKACKCPPDKSCHT